jgi:hypothetical protein
MAKVGNEMKFREFEPGVEITVTIVVDRDVSSFGIPETIDLYWLLKQWQYSRGVARSGRYINLRQVQV